VPVNLSIKNVPDDMANALRDRAALNHRSLQGELLAILESVLRPRPRLTVPELLRDIRERGLRTPSNSVEIIRSDRDRR
jgi:plasmid stability protein